MNIKKNQQQSYHSTINNQFHNIVKSYCRKQQKYSIYKSQQKCNKHLSLSKLFQKQDNNKFEPQIHALSNNNFKSNRQKYSKQLIFQRLIEDSRKKKQLLKLQKMKKQEQQCYNNCTFKPDINDISKRIATGKYGNIDTFERLYEDGISKIKSLDVLNLTQQSPNDQNYTFKPTINSKSYNMLNKQKHNLAPIQQRINEILKIKRQKLKRMKKQQQQKNIYKNFYKNKKNEIILINNKQFKQNVLERLFNYIKIKNKKQQMKQKQYNIKIEEMCPFKPNINISSLNYEQNGQNFTDRQKLFAENLQKRLQDKKELMKESFHPKINRISNLLVENQREKQTYQDKIQRLHYQPLIEKQQRIQQIQEQIYQHCTFQPQINVISKVLNAKSTPHQCNCKSKEQSYQFQPKIDSKSRKIAKQNEGKNYNSEQQMQKMKMEKQYKQMQHCTFKPKINKNRLKCKNNSLQNVKGVQQFLKKIQIINEKKQQSIQFKNKLFHKEQYYQPRKFTRPECFKLSERQGYTQSLLEEQKRRFQKQCPFQPQLKCLR